MRKAMKGRFNVLERAKIDQQMADYISQQTLQHGCSRGQVIREALQKAMTYEKSELLEAVSSLQLQVDEIAQRLQAMGRYQEQRFEQLLKAVKAYRKPV